MNEFLIPSVSDSNVPMNLGEALSAFAMAGIECRDIDFEVLASGHPTLPEVAKQWPDAGEKTKCNTDAILTINPGSVRPKTVDELHDSIARRLKLRSTQEMALETLGQLVAVRNSVARQCASEAYDGDFDQKTILGKIEILSATTGRAREKAFLELLMDSANVIRLIEDDAFRRLVKADFAGFHNKYVEARLSFFLLEDTLRAEQQLAGEDMQRLQRLKRYLLLLFATLDQLDGTNSRSLVRELLVELLRSGAMGMTQDELKALFDETQVRMLLNEIETRRETPFSVSTFRTKLQRYLTIPAESLETEYTRSTLTVSFKSELDQVQRKRAEILVSLFVPIYIEATLRFLQPLWILGKTGSSRLGHVRLGSLIQERPAQSDYALK